MTITAIDRVSDKGCEFSLPFHEEWFSDIQNLYREKAREGETIQYWIVRLAHDAPKEKGEKI
jgi:hypothetical protein